MVVVSIPSGTTCRPVDQACHRKVSAMAAEEPGTSWFIWFSLLISKKAHREHLASINSRGSSGSSSNSSSSSSSTTGKKKSKK